MIQPDLPPAAELASLLARYDTGAMPPGIAARVAELRRIIAGRLLDGVEHNAMPEVR
jgi:hypothetical protein